jgi:hypothetical protein
MNKNLHNARRAKNDEFYTQLVDIENELRHYREYFKAKTVFSNCDDPYVSNFFQYFSKNFERLGLKRFITTCYKNDQVDMFSQNNVGQSIYFEYNGSQNKNGVPDKKEIGESKKYLESNGDFRSDECIELLKQSDIIVTNPPFSLFRQYVAQLMEYEKKFLIIGSYNAVTYKEIFPLIKENKMWIGVTLDGRNIWFEIPDNYEKYHKIEDGAKYAFVAGAIWYTNLPHKKRNEKLILVKNYKGNEDSYPKYDNYDAIEVSRVVNIPKDYDGVMGVPITFLNKYNSEQFEIIWQASGNTRASGPKEVLDRLNYQPHTEDRGGCAIINGKRSYSRILIKRR